MFREKRSHRVQIFQKLSAEIIFMLAYFSLDIILAHSFPRTKLSGCFSEQMLPIKYFRSRAIGLKASHDRI